MKYEVFEDEHYYVCHDGRELRHIWTETKEQEGYTQTFEVYGCADCSGCGHKAKCLYKYNGEKGILNRQIRSIQTEEHFGYIKENEKFRRFNYQSTEKVYRNLCCMRLAEI